ncbi:MAG: 3-deoxy-D-manno-octulosonic acid transferase [Chlamydiia bacterium]
MTLVAAPLILSKYLFQKKYRGILFVRLGLKIPRLQLDPEKSTLWVHAASLGEMRAAGIFIEKIRLEYPDHQIVTSCLTTTGFEEARKIPNVFSIILPSDLFTRHLIAKIEPDILFLVEGDIWPNMVHAAKKVIVVNGKLSERTAFFLQRFPFLRTLLLKPIDHWLVQSPIHRERLLNLGFPEEQIHVTGDIKASALADNSAPYPREGILLVSTHKGEERLLLEALLPTKTFLILAPRHPERFPEVEELLKELQVSYTLYSSKTTAPASQVLLIDQMGVLPQFYKACKVSIVGGSFVEGVGGHNLLEPLIYGSIPMFGPYIHKQLHLKEFLDLHEVGILTQPHEVFEKLEATLTDPQNLVRLQQRIAKAKESMGQALEKTLTTLKSLS